MSKLEYWFVFQNDQILLSNSNSLLDGEALSKLELPLLRQHYIGEFNQVACYCAEIDKNFLLPNQAVTVYPLRKAFELVGLEWYVAIVKAQSIINWDKNHKFCGRCGHETIHNIHYLYPFERYCPLCSLTVYPRISPSIIVLITKGDNILMARSPHFPKGSYGLIAGFVEVGESVEEAVHREVMEEVNIKIKNLQYFDSQPWPFPDSLILGFTAEYASGELKIDNREIEDAGWYHYNNLPSRPSSVSLARKLIEFFINEQTKAS